MPVICGGIGKRTQADADRATSLQEADRMNRIDRMNGGKAAAATGRHKDRMDRV
jgi:hypothetical protein